VSVDAAIEYLQSRREDVARRRARQSGVWEGRPGATLPLAMTCPMPDAFDDLPARDYKACYYDPEVMLASQLRGCVAAAASPGDGVPSLRANLGTGLLPTVLGAYQEVFDDKMPWVTRHVPKDVLQDMQPSDINVYRDGEMPRALEYCAYFMDRLKGAVAIYVPDTQGPFDVAHLVLGDAIFYELYDDPEFVHHLMELTTHVSIEATRAVKQVTGEPLDAGAHGNHLWMSGTGARVCEDTSTLLCPEHVAEFVIPYADRVGRAFGSAWVHYCGRSDPLQEQLLPCAHVRALNLGNTDMHDMASYMKGIRKHDKLYVGGWPRKQDESIRDYFRRLLDHGDDGVGHLVAHVSPPTPEDGMSPEEAVELWYSLQE